MRLRKLGFGVLLLLIPSLSWSEALTVGRVEYNHPADRGSCGLLRAREQERLKVIREMIHLNGLAKNGRTNALLLSNTLIVNKLFMPREVWNDVHAEVTMTVAVPEKMQHEIRQIGLGRVFLSFRAPGLVWHSYLNQLPREMEVSVDANLSQLSIRYFTYLTVTCLDLPAAPPPRIDWVPSHRADRELNTHEILVARGN